MPSSEPQELMAVLGQQGLSGVLMAGVPGPPGLSGPTGPAGPAGPHGPQGLPTSIRNEGVGLTPQPILDFVGSGVTATNDAANNRTVVTIPGDAVASVFGRNGAVVAANGDYTAAQVTNAVDKTQFYADPSWITSLDWAKIANEPSTFPPSAHTHAASDV